jgi:Tol biopolymer transport system component/DNA-binding winged helix-turn-helix (wHTH) protein
MPYRGKELYEFGPFRLDPAKRLLLRDNQPVPIQLKAFETLLVLVRNSEQVVLKDDLMKAVWPDTFVEESNLAQNIFVLRKALSAAGDSRYIVTIPGRGYSFTGKVRVIEEEESLVVESHSRTRMVVEEETFPDVEMVVATAVATKGATLPSTTLRQKILFGAAIVAAGVVALAFRPQVAPPQVTRIRQITHLGTLVHNTKLVTDGPRVYFRAWDGKDRVIRYVSSEGGDVFPLEKAFPNMDIDDISPSGSELLGVDLQDRRRTAATDEEGDPSLWRIPLPAGSPRPVGDIHSRDARWSPDARAIVCAIGNDLYLVNPDGSNLRKAASLPGVPFHPVWSPDGKRLRVAVAGPLSIGSTLWEVNLADGSVHPLLPDSSASSRALPGGWSPDGKYFFYSTLDEGGTRNLWAMREAEILRRVNPRPQPVTAGPLTFYVPVPSKDGKSIFAVGEQLRGQLLSYDPASKQLAPYAQGISADAFSFSREGKWMAYIEFPEANVVRSRVDGSERRRLTFPPMRAFSPQWSPDGSQIAFQASTQGGPSHIYVVAANGGAPVPASPQGKGQQKYPSWTSDGASLLFSSSDELGAHPSLSLLNLNTKQLSPLPETAGLIFGQISPDGRTVAAVEESSGQLVLYDTASHQSKILAAGPASYPTWSADGKSLYFNTSYWNSKGIKGGVYRWTVSTDVIKLIAPNPEFLLTGLYGVCYSITPDGQVLMLRDISTRDLYALDLDMP